MAGGQTAKRIAIAVACLGALLAVILLRRPAAGLVEWVAEWVEGLGWIAPVAFTAVFSLAVPLLVPAAPFLLIAGILFGPLLGTVYGFAGTVMGGALSFGLARSVLRRRMRRRLEPLAGFAALQKALRREGLRGAALIRLSPLLPAWLINYALGISPITWRQYLLSSLAVLPTVAVYALSGSGLGDLAAFEGGAGLRHGLGYYAVLAGGIGATIAASVLLGRRARRILEATDDDRDE